MIDSITAGKKAMYELLLILVFFVGWYLLNAVILPKLGFNT